MVLTDNIARFQTTLFENERPLRTTLRENETTLFENRPITSALDHISRRTSFRIPSESSPQNCPTKPGPVLGVPEAPKILYAPAVGQNPVGLYVPLLG